MHLSFEENQEAVAFWEWGMGNGELAKEYFCCIFDAPGKLALEKMDKADGWIKIDRDSRDEG